MERVRVRLPGHLLGRVAGGGGVAVDVRGVPAVHERVLPLPEPLVVFHGFFPMTLAAPLKEPKNTSRLRTTRSEDMSAEPRVFVLLEDGDAAVMVRHVEPAVLQRDRRGLVHGARMSEQGRSRGVAPVDDGDAGSSVGHVEE